MNVTILRLEHSHTETLGSLLIDDQMFCCTLELPWRENRVNISRIPEGFYEAIRINSENHGPTFCIRNVKQRSEIMFHVGNTHRDTRGCPLLGMLPGKMGNDRAVLHSMEAMSKFLTATEGEESLHLAIWSTQGGRT